MYLLRDLEWHSSTIDWCEVNYQVSPLVAEFWNTISNAPMVFLPICWILLCKDYLRRLNPEMVVFSVGTIVVGLSSAYFHWTLSMMGQLLDELSILWLLGIGAAFYIPKSYFPYILASSRVTFQRNLATVTVLCSLISYRVPIINIPLLFIYGWFLWKPGSEILKRTNTDAERWLKLRCVFFWCTAFVSWCLDKFTCNLLLAVQMNYLHSLWHVCVVLSFYPAVVLLDMLESRRKFPNFDVNIVFWPVWTGGMGLPCIVVKDKPQVHSNSHKDLKSPGPKFICSEDVNRNHQRR